MGPGGWRLLLSMCAGVFEQEAAGAAGGLL